MLVYFAVILSVLIGLCGMAVDVARMQMRSNQLPAAADAGALAAAGELAHGGSGSLYQTAATNDVAAYESANGIPSTAAVSTVISPTYGYYQNDNSTVQVTVTQSFPLIFMAMFTGRSAATLSVKAVSQMPPCMVFLGSPTVNPSGHQDLWLASSKMQTFTAGCPVYANDGILVDGSSSIYGGQVRSSSAGSMSSFGATTYAPIYNAPIINDPLAYISEPSVGSCTNGSTPISDLSQSTGTTITLNPGTYCGKTNSTATYVPGPGAACNEVASKITPAIDIEGKSTSTCPSDNSRSTCSGIPTVVFNPGLYVIVGGMTLDCVTAVSTGATLFFTQNSNVAYGQMNMTSTAWQVNAPNASSNQSIPGIVLMSARSWTGTAEDFRFTFNTWNADGVIYVTGTGIYASGTPMSAPNYLNIVASNLYNYGGAINAGTNYANLPAGNPLELNPSLVQ